MMVLAIGQMGMSVDEFLDLTYEEFHIKLEGFNDSSRVKFKDMFYCTHWLYTRLASVQVTENGQKALGKEWDEFQNSFLGKSATESNSKVKKLTSEEIASRMALGKSLIKQLKK